MSHRSAFVTSFAAFAALIAVSATRVDAGGPSVFFGLEHNELNNATLSMDPAGRMVIANIGSSGQDGVSIMLTQPTPPGGVTPGWAGEIDFGPAGGLPAGSELRVRAGALGLGPVAGFRIAEVNGGHGAVSFEQVLCDACEMTVELRRDGAVMSSATYPGSHTDVLVTGDIGTTLEGSVPFLIGGRKADDDVIDFTLIVLNEQPMSLAGLPPVETDAVVVRLNGLPPGTRYIGNLTITGSDTGPIVVETEVLLKTASTGKVKFFNEAKGFGRIIGGGDLDGDGIPDIVVSEIGSSGQDGVRVGNAAAFPYEADPNIAQAVEVDFGDAGDLPPDAVFAFITNTHDTPAGTGGAAFQLTVEETNGGQGAVSIATMGLGHSFSFKVDAVLHGVVVDSVVLTNPPPPVLAVGPIGSQGSDGVEFYSARQESCGSNPAQGHHFLNGMRWPAPGPVTLTDSPLGPVTANEIQISVMPTDSPEPFGSMTLLASNMSSFTILNGEERREFINDLTHDGLQHMALGGASLALTADGSLQISGDWNNDGTDTVGVSIRLGEAEGWSGEIDFGQGGALPQGTEIKLEPRQMLTPTPFALRINETGGGSAAVSVEQDICPTCSLHVELLLDGQVVGSAVYPPPYPAQLVTGNIGSSGESRCFVKSWSTSGDADDRPTESVFNPVVTPMRLTGPFAPVDAQCVRISLQGLPPGSMAHGISFVDVTAHGLADDLVIAREQVTLFLSHHKAIGDAEMCASVESQFNQPSERRLTVQGIGSSGQDNGVDIRTPDDDCDGTPELAEQISVALEALRLQPGGSRAITTKGTGAVVLAGALAWDVFLQLDDIEGETEEVTVDFSQLGATTHHAAIYLDGTLVAQASGQSGPLVATRPAGVARDIDECKKRPLLAPVRGRGDEGAPDDTIEMSIGWVSPAPITLTSGIAAVGDKLTVTAENPTVGVGGISSMALTGANLLGNEFTIIDETIVLVPPPAPCPSDINGDDSTDVNDLLLLIGAWGSNDPAADINDDNIVDVNDLLLLIGGWGDC